MWPTIIAILGPLLARIGHILIDKYLDHECEDGDECKTKFQEYSDQIEKKKIYKVKKRK